jgi:hypothetical protein
MRKEADRRARQVEKFIKHTLDLNFNFEDFGGIFRRGAVTVDREIIGGRAGVVKAKAGKGEKGKGERGRGKGESKDERRG